MILVLRTTDGGYVVVFPTFTAEGLMVSAIFVRDERGLSAEGVAAGIAVGFRTVRAHAMSLARLLVRGRR